MKGLSGMDRHTIGMLLARQIRHYVMSSGGLYVAVEGIRGDTKKV